MSETTNEPRSDGARPESLRLRHRPVQRRGEVRFEQILAAARQLLMDKGIEGFVVEDVASQAGIPVGSVYQFFPNKFAIVAELAEIDTRELIGMVTSFGGIPPGSRISENADAIVSMSVERWTRDPSKSAVWLALKSTESTRALADEQAHRVGLSIAPLLKPMNPAITDEQAELAATLIVELTEAILLYSFRSGEVNAPAVEELKRVLRGYLSGLAHGR